jgi:hypothetical protein
MIPNQPYVTVFPNPTSMKLTFQFTLPDNLNEYEIIILNSNAQEVKREKINSRCLEYIMDTDKLGSGTYYYSLCTKLKSYQSGKFTVTK